VTICQAADAGEISAPIWAQGTAGAGQLEIRRAVNHQAVASFMFDDFVVRAPAAMAESQSVRYVRPRREHLDAVTECLKRTRRSRIERARRRMARVRIVSYND
jgi:RNA polymerase-interacting CarD/CdnL/TRCF family regulator